LFFHCVIIQKMRSLTANDHRIEVSDVSNIL
jgi:hypothetical protein